MDLQKKFDQLEEIGVLKHPEDLNIALDKLNPSFLVKKPNSGSRLVMAFTDEGRYGKPQPSLMPDVDSTFHQTARWKQLITDLTIAFYQILLISKSMKYCRVVSPFKSVWVYIRSTMRMPGSKTA